MAPSSSVVFISGCPGSGKSSLARSLASLDPHSIHLHTDDFYDYVTHKIDPTTPDSHAQNVAVVRAFLAASREFVAANYRVYLDGVVGPWWFPTIAEFFSDIDLVLLHVELGLALERTRQREVETGIPAPAHMVEVMNHQFAAIEGLDKQRVRTDALSPENVTDLVSSGLMAGQYRIGLQN